MWFVSLVLLDRIQLHILYVRNGYGCILDPTITVHPHDGPRGLEDISGFLLNAFMIIMIPGLLMALDRCQCYGKPWKSRYIQGDEKSYLSGSLWLGEGLVVGSW